MSLNTHARPSAPILRYRLGFFVLLVAIAGAGCAGKDVRPSPRRPLTILEPIAALGLDPHTHADFATFAVLSNIYQALTELDAGLKVRPCLARSWESLDDLRWRFHLRGGVHFHDGRPLTSADVVFSLERAQRLKGSDVAGYLLAVRDVRATDAATVEIATKRPYPLLPVKLAFVLVVPAGSPDDLEQDVGTGPYRVTSWVPGRRVELEAFRGYWGAPPSEPRAVYEYVASSAARRERLSEGTADIVSQLAPHDVDRLGSTSGCRTETRAGMDIAYLQVQTNKGPFSDLRMRQALDLSLDREALVARDLDGAGRPAGEMVGRGVFGFVPDLAPAAQSLEEARRLLRAAGYPHGLDLELSYRGDRRIEELLRQLAEAGFRTRPSRASDWESLYARLRAHEVPFYLGASIADSGDAGDVLDTKFHTPDPARGYGTSNFNGYSNPELDRLIEASNRSRDLEERRGLLQSCLRLLGRELPVIPLYSPDETYGVRQGVVWTPRLDERILAREVRRSPR